MADGIRLGQWLVVQRRKCRGGTLSQDKLSRLTSIGFICGEGESFVDSMHVASKIVR